MVASYLTDVENALEAQRWDAALCEAYDLPRIAVALTDPTLQSSGDSKRPGASSGSGPPIEDDDDGLDYQRVRRTVCEHIEHEQDAADAAACRPVRCAGCGCAATCAPHRAASSRMPCPAADPEASESARICTALVDAARRWYARSACHNTIVQANLARLAVLR